MEDAREVLGVGGDFGIALPDFIVEHGGDTVLVDGVKCVHYA